MDGLPLPRFDRATFDRSTAQRTLKAPIGCVGTGLHSGEQISLTLRPNAANGGIVFRRSDLGIDIPARFDHVADTRLCTILETQGARVGTVEHVMAALAACGVDNAIIEVDGAEIPVLDGSAAPFVFLIDCAGTVEQDAVARAIEVRRVVRVEDAGSFVELHPSGTPGLDIDVSIAFAAAAIGQQSLSMHLTETSFRAEISAARTFAMASDIAGLQAIGLARGGSLDNAIVVDDARILNPAGLRMPDEFVRHKVLDVIGDLALAGAAIHGRLVAHRPGHGLNNRLLRALFADAANWAWTDVSAQALAAQDWTPAQAGWSLTMAAAA